MHHVVCFSGGKDSTAMLFKMLEVGRKIDRIVCVDTTKEFPAMYDHIRQVQDRIPIKIDIVKIRYDYYFSQHIKRNGLAGYGWCDHMVRWCTKLKSMETRNFLNSIGFDKKDTIEYHGIAMDESHRTKKNAASGKNIAYPLVEMGMSEADCLQYCYDLGFTWGGLYREGRKRVSCFCCPLQDLDSLRLTYTFYPNLWRQMLEMDKLSCRKFRKDYTLQELDAKFAYEAIHGRIRGRVKR